MLRIIQAVLAVTTMLIVFIVFSLGISPLGKAAESDLLNPQLVFCEYGSYPDGTCNNDYCPNDRYCNYTFLQESIVGDGRLCQQPRNEDDNVLDCCPAGMILNSTRDRCIDPPAWETVGTPIESNGFSGSVFVRTDKVTHEPVVAYPEGSGGDFKITVKKYNETSNAWSTVGASRFTNSIGLSIQGRFAFDTCGDGTMIVVISDATVNGRPTGYRFQNGSWTMLGTVGFSANNALYGIGMLCQPYSNYPYVYIKPDPSGVGDGKTMGYNHNPGLGGWVSIQEIPCTTTSWLYHLGTDSIEVSPTDNFIWYSCANASVSEFTGTQWNMPVSSQYSSNANQVRELAFDESSSRWVEAVTSATDTTVNTIYASTGGTNFTQLGASQDLPAYYSGRAYAASLAYNKTAGKLWYAVPTAANTFTVREFSGSSWGTVLAPFTETGLQADDIDLYHDPVCTGATYIALAMQQDSTNTDIVVKRDNRYTPCPSVPTVVTNSVSSVTAATATVDGFVDDDGYSGIIERGAVYSTTNSAPTLSDSRTTNAGTIGPLHVPLSDLLPGTHYYARAYATNTAGTGYGSVVEFTTEALPSTETPTPTPTVTVTTTNTPTPTITQTPTGTVTQTQTPTGTVTPPLRTLTPLITTEIPPTTLTVRRAIQQSPVCPIITSFTSSPVIAQPGERVTLSWTTLHATSATINGSSVRTSGTTPYIVDGTTQSKLIADNGACIASATLNFTNPAAEQIQTATTVGASALVADLLIQQIVSLGTTALGSSSAVLTTNLWGIALSVFNRKKKRQSWGIVYDAQTKNPLGRAVVRLLNLDTEAVVDTVVSDAQGVFQLKTQPGRYIIRVVRTGYQFPSKLVKGENDGGYSNVYYGEVLLQGNTDKQATVSIPLDPISETVARRKARKMFDYGVEALNTASTLTLFAGLGYSMYVAMLYPLPINIGATIAYAIVCFGKLLLTLWTPRSFGRVTMINGKALPGVELGIFDREFNTLLYRTFTNEKGEYNFAVPNREYVLKLMDAKYYLYGSTSAQDIILPRLKNKSASEVRLIAIDLLVKQQAHGKA